MTSPILRDPLHSALLRVVDEPVRALGEGRRLTGFAPPLDVRETEDAYLVMVDLPGVKPDDVTVELDGRTLTISGARVPVETGSARLAERPYGSFVRALKLPKGVEGDAIEADYHDGVLELHVPKPEEAKPKRIAIGGGSRQKALEA